MKLIKQVEIKHFRSFLGTPQKYETTICDLADLNIFSGSNDSGKSNILRALNIFFNDEISHETPFAFERDFFSGKKDAGHRVVEITISFDLSTDRKRDKFLPEKFKISKFYNRDGFRNYLYSFSLKEKTGEIRVDSRAENNESLKQFFLPKDPTEDDQNSAGKREWNYRVKFSGFLNKSISFEYVPAIRDKNFFAQLFGRVITRIKNNEDKRIAELKKEKNKINNWQNTLKNKTEKKEFKENIKSSDWRSIRLKEIDDTMMKEGRFASAIVSLEDEINKYSQGLISSISFLNSEFKIGKNLQGFFEGFDVGTGAEKSISLSLRGDGIQAKYVPKILNFLSDIDGEKKYFIWGFEEPENSAEYRNQQALAKELRENFSKNKQIFITTHSEEFLQLYDGPEIKKEMRSANLYHVKKMSDADYEEYSQVFLFDVDNNEFEFANQKTRLEDDLGQSYLRAKYSKELKNREDLFLKEKMDIQKENQKLQALLIQNNKPLLFVEDTYDDLYKIAWLKLAGKVHSKAKFAAVFEEESPFLIFKAEGATCLAGFLRMKNADFLKNRKIVGLFDFDQTGVNQFKSLSNETYWNEPALGDKHSGLYKKRSDHPCFYTLLLPIPDRLKSLADLAWPSFVEIENLLPHSFLLNNTFATEEKTTGNTTYLKINENKKTKISEKVFDLSADDFNDFKPLFEKINSLLEI
jgi:hypothetical protein